jgi:hypothetical protein
LDDRFRIEEQRSAVATATAAHDPEADIGGPDDDVANVLNIQPVIPFTIGDWNLINRSIVPDRVVGRKGRPVRASRDRHQPFWSSSAPKVARSRPGPHPAAYALVRKSQIRLIGRRRLAMRRPKCDDQCKQSR